MLQLNFLGVIVQVESEWEAVIKLLSKDFACFIDTKRSLKPNLKVRILNINAREIDFPKLKIKYKSKNSITFQDGNVRYNDYYGQVKTIFDYNQNSAEIFSNDVHRVHEIAYLLILSRTGKTLDLQGIHKVHAFAISYKETALMCMMPSGGGKSTLLLHLLKYDGVKLISDDIPLFDESLNLIPMPLKIGLVKDANICIEVLEPQENIYSMKREFYGEKKLICLAGLKEKVETRKFQLSNVIVMEAFRMNSGKSRIKNANFFNIWSGFFKHAILGIGTPIILEYFWEFGFRDFVVKTRIFLKRLVTFTRVSISSNKFHFSMGENIDENAQQIINFLESCK